jgi:hypothetical protein
MHDNKPFLLRPHEWCKDSNDGWLSLFLNQGGWFAGWELNF